MASSSSRSNNNQKQPNNKVMNNLLADDNFKNTNLNLKVVKSDIAPSGEAIHVVRPYAPTNQSSDRIVKQLANQYGYKTNNFTAEKEDLDTFQKAFPKIANALINSYEGSTIQSDSNQDLIGDKYLAEQIKRINEENKHKSILDKWSHLLYEGEDERTYTSATDVPITDLTGLKPVSSKTFSINSNKSQSQNPNNMYF